MLTIHHAILHSFDLRSGEIYLSARELDLDDRKAKSFVTRHVKKASQSMDNNHGQFTEDSGFAQELSRYLAGYMDFLEFSQQIGRFFYEELRKGDQEAPCDLLVVDFENQPDQRQMEDDPERMSQAFEGQRTRYFIMLLLPRKEIFIHSMYGEGGQAVAEVMRTDACLPSPTQKIDTYAVVDCNDMSVAFKDKPRTIAGATTYLIPAGLLSCSHEASSKEVIESVVTIVEDVAEEYGMNSTVALSKAKAYVTDCAENEQDVNPEEVGRKVFQGEPDKIETFQKKAEIQHLPETVQVKKGQTTRMTKVQKIKTDTGVEISFPSQYADSTDFIEFISEADGTLNIHIKGIGSIENK